MSKRERDEKRVNDSDEGRKRQREKQREKGERQSKRGKERVKGLIGISICKATSFTLQDITTLKNKKEEKDEEKIEKRENRNRGRDRHKAVTVLKRNRSDVKIKYSERKYRASNERVKKV